MKFLPFTTIMIAVLGVSMTACAAKNSVNRDRLRIDVKTFDDNPSSWLRFYGHSGSNVIPITLIFNIDNIRALSVTDENVVNNKCRSGYYKKNILYLSFAADKNIHKIKTRIDLPCLSQRASVLKLRVITTNSDEYVTTQKFEIDKRSVAQQIVDTMNKSSEF